MSILVLVEMEAKSDAAEALKGSFASILPDTRAFDGCESISAHVNLDDPNQIVLVQRWTSREQYERYLEWRRGRGDIGNQATQLTRPPTIRHFGDIGD